MHYLDSCFPLVTQALGAAQATHLGCKLSSLFSKQALSSLQGILTLLDAFPCSLSMHTRLQSLLL